MYFMRKSNLHFLNYNMLKNCKIFTQYVYITPKDFQGTELYGNTGYIKCGALNVIKCIQVRWTEPCIHAVMKVSDT